MDEVFFPDWPLAPNNYLTFGLLVIAGVLSGHFIRRLRWAPSITGYILVGLVLGPHALNLVTAEMLDAAKVFIDVAIGLILYQLGLSLDIGSVSRRGELLLASLTESGLTFALVSGAMFLFGLSLPVALLVGAIAISASPAVLVHVAREVRAQGPATEAARVLVALNNVISFLAYSAVLPLVHQVNEAPWQVAIFHPVYRLLGSLLLGVVMAVATVHIGRWISKEQEYRLALVVGAVILALGLARALHCSALFTLLVLGIVVRSYDRTDQRLHAVEIGPPTEILYIVMFVAAGAILKLDSLSSVGLAALALVLLRGLAKWGAVSLILRRSGIAAPVAQATGLLLLPMASLAIGLATRTAQLFPELAATASAIVLGAVAVLETIGPPITALAFRLAGETGKARAAVVPSGGPHSSYSTSSCGGARPSRET